MSIGNVVPNVVLLLSLFACQETENQDSESEEVYHAPQKMKMTTGISKGIETLSTLNFIGDLRR